MALSIAITMLQLACHLLSVLRGQYYGYCFLILWIMRTILGGKGFSLWITLCILLVEQVFVNEECFKYRL